MRRLDWPERLAAQVERARLLPFTWGEHDCILWTCDVVRELTGIDPALQFRGKYRTSIEAAHILRKIGGEGLEAAVDAVCAEHGFESIAPSLSRRGDVVLCPSLLDSWPFCLAVCIGSDAVTTGGTGLVRIPMRLALKAWRVG